MSLYRNYFIWFCVCLTLVLTTTVDRENCDESKCPGPLAYYKVLGCKPMYKEDENCCAWKYNCDHLKNLGKCYLNGIEYSHGEIFYDKYTGYCTCKNILWPYKVHLRYTPIGFAIFHCSSLPLVSGLITVILNWNYYYFNCYEDSPRQCGDKFLSILKVNKSKDVPGFQIEKYPADYSFIPKENPHLQCIYSLVDDNDLYANVTVFCERLKCPYCDRGRNEDRNRFLRNCSPIYDNNKNLLTASNKLWRCANRNDIVIRVYNQKSIFDNDTCKYGNIEMHIGDELMPNTDGYSACVKCVCEVPPILTCTYMSDCDIGLIWNIVQCTGTRNCSIK